MTGEGGAAAPGDMGDAHLIDLASRALGGSVLVANDETYAEKENLIKVAEPTFTPATMGPARPDLRRVGDPPPPRRGLRLGDPAARRARRGAPGRRRHRVLPRQLPGRVRHRDVLARRLAGDRRAGRAAVLAHEGGAAEAEGRHAERRRDPAHPGHPRAADDPPGRRRGPAARARRGRAGPAAMGRAHRRPRRRRQRRHGARRQRPLLLPARERDPPRARGDDGRRVGDPPAPRWRLRLAAAGPGGAGADPAVLHRHRALRRQLPGRHPADGDRQHGRRRPRGPPRSGPSCCPAPGSSPTPGTGSAATPGWTPSGRSTACAWSCIPDGGLGRLRLWGVPSSTGRAGRRDARGGTCCPPRDAAWQVRSCCSSRGVGRRAGRTSARSPTSTRCAPRRNGSPEPCPGRTCSRRWPGTRGSVRHPRGGAGRRRRRGRSRRASRTTRRCGPRWPRATGPTRNASATSTWSGPRAGRARRCWRCCASGWATTTRPSATSSGGQLAEITSLRLRRLWGEGEA